MVVKDGVARPTGGAVSLHCNARTGKPSPPGGLARQPVRGLPDAFFYGALFVWRIGRVAEEAAPTEDDAKRAAAEAVLRVGF
jgi:hypothetical protein